MSPEPELAEPVRVPAPAPGSSGPLTTPATRAPVIAALRGTDPDARAEELWKLGDAATDFADQAWYKRASLIVSFRGRPGMTEAELDKLVDDAIGVARFELLAYSEFGEARFLQWTRVFPNMWASRVEQALLLPADEAAARKEHLDRLRDLENVSALVPPHVLKYGLPISLERARTIQAFRLSPDDIKHDHITQPYLKAAYKFMGTRVLAAQIGIWNGVARATAEEVEEGRKIVTVADLTDFQKRAGVILAGIPDRLRMTSWDDPALRVFERDLLSLRDVALLQGFGAGLAGLTGVWSGWAIADKMFSDRLREVNPSIRGGGIDNAWRALNWAYDWGYYGKRAKEVKDAIVEHGWTILATAIGFIVVQFIPGLNVVVDVAVIIWSGIDALLALESMISAFKAAWDAATLFQLERGTARVADAVVGDGFRLLMDMVGIALGIRGLKMRAARIRAQNAKLTEQQAARQALEEAVGKVGRRITPAEEFLARHGNSNLARQAIRAAGGNVDDAAVVLRLLQGTRPTAADLAVLQRIAPSLHELALASEAASAAGLNPLTVVNFLRDPAIAVGTRTAVAQGLRRLMAAGLTDAELTGILTHFNRADDLALALRALDDLGAGGAAARDTLRTAAQEGRTAADVVRAVRGAAPTALATAAERLAHFIREWLGTVIYRTGDQARAIAEILIGNRRIRISEYDLNHYLNGHTFEQFAFTPQNINRAAQSTFWPPGTATETILAHARLALHNAAPEIQGAIAAGNQGFFRVPRPVPVGGYTYQVGIDLATGRLTQFFPLNGPGVIPIPRAELHQIRAALQNAGRVQ